jgi:hypothetical protein
LVEEGFAVSYDAASGFYLVTLPGLGATRAAEDDFGGIKLVDTVPTLRGTFTPMSPSNLQYTRFGYYDSADLSATGRVVFGTPTPHDAVPTSGTATYKVSLEGSISFGDGSMAFDFAKGDLSGHVQFWQSGPYDNYDAGLFQFSNTKVSASAGTFSGNLVNANLGTGSFAGLFAGPHAEEVMGRFQAPIYDWYSGTKKVDYGVFAGTSTP